MQHSGNRPVRRCRDLSPDSPDEMAFGHLRAPILASRSSSYAGSGSRVLTDATGERRNRQFRQRFRGLRPCRPNLCGDSGVNRVCRVALLTQKQICPRIDKGVNALRSPSFTNGCDPPGMVDDWTQGGPLKEAVFEIDPGDPAFKEPGHSFGQRTIDVPGSPYELNGPRWRDRAYDARDDLL